jgi:hypothetical protein
MVYDEAGGVADRVRARALVLTFHPGGDGHQIAVAFPGEA